jgi:hypothetical protein
MADSGEREGVAVTVSKEDQLCGMCMVGLVLDCSSGCDFVACLDHDIDKAKEAILKFEAPAFRSSPMVSTLYKDKVEKFLALQKEYQEKMEYHRDYYRALWMVRECECKRAFDRQDQTMLSICGGHIHNLQDEITFSRIEFTAKSDALLEHLDPVEHIRVTSARVSKYTGFHDEVESFKLSNGIPLLGEGGI